MRSLVADTSGLVSLGIASRTDPGVLGLCLARFSVSVPETVVDELRELAAYDDIHADGAESALDRLGSMTVNAVRLDDRFPLDDGENAAVTLAKDVGASLLLCDEFNQLGLIHASLADTRLVTTPTLLSVFVRNGQLSSTDALEILDQLSQARSWAGNSYVERARSLLEPP